jgi:hypothetical protein
MQFVGDSSGWTDAVGFKQHLLVLSQVLVQICISCLQEKDVQEFPFKNIAPDVHDDHCRTCHARADVAHRLQSNLHWQAAAAHLTKVSPWASVF